MAKERLRETDWSHVYGTQWSQRMTEAIDSPGTIEFLEARGLYARGIDWLWECSGGTHRVLLKAAILIKEKKAWLQGTIKH